MTYQLSLGQRAVLQNLLDNEEYFAGYQYIADSLDDAVANNQIPSGTQKWFEFATQINAGSGSWSSNLVRFSTKNAGALKGINCRTSGLMAQI